MAAVGLNGSVSFVHSIGHKIKDIKNKAEPFFGYIRASEEAYAVIRAYNMTKCNVFPDEMLTEPKSAITLFLKKEELKLKSVPID